MKKIITPLKWFIKLFKKKVKEERIKYSGEITNMETSLFDNPEIQSLLKDSKVVKADIYWHSYEC